MSLFCRSSLRVNPLSEFGARTTAGRGIDLLPESADKQVSDGKSENLPHLLRRLRKVDVLPETREDVLLDSGIRKLL